MGTSLSQTVNATAPRLRRRWGLFLLVSAGALGLLPLCGLAETNATPREADRCVDCHEVETEEWSGSRHATALDEVFLGEWARVGEKWECLVCHASDYDREAATYAHGGISCKSCHGPVSEDHPDSEQKTLPVTSETCQNCHSVTYGEWRVSSHGQQDIRCFDCHTMHKMELRSTDSDAMCGTCHTERLEDYSHATHHVKGVKCITCHMPEAPGEGLKIKGTGAMGHTFTVGAETCSRCHREMVHSRSDIAHLEGEVERLKEIAPDELQEKVNALESELQRLRAVLHANRIVYGVVVVLAFGLGLVIEYGMAHHRARRRAEAAAKERAP